MKSQVWGNSECPVTQPYGCTALAVEPPDPACPGGHFHCGIDVAMALGTALFAARAGIVDYVGYGLLAIRVGDEHDWYVHIDRVAHGISPFNGAPILLGQLVAFSGNKAPSGGFTTGPHLHFESQRGSINTPASSINPVPILEGNDVTDSEKRAWCRLAYVAGLGREPESDAVLESHASQILDDGSNVDAVIASQIIDSAEGVAWLAKLRAAVNAPSPSIPPHTHTVEAVTGPSS